VLAQLDELPPDDGRRRGLDNPVARLRVNRPEEAQDGPRVNEELGGLAVGDGVRDDDHVTGLDRDELLREERLVV
jgi:hypothetical protein